MPNPISARSNWNLKDVFDFEYQRRLDDAIDEAQLEQRDRAIFREHCAGGENERQLLRGWLQVVRQQRVLNPEPGILFVHCYRLLALAAGLFAVLSGVSATWVALKYDGSVPVNVSVFLGLIVAPQILLLLGYLIVVVGSLMRAGWIAMLYVLPTKAARFLLKMLWTEVTRRAWLKGEKRDKLKIKASSFTDILHQHSGLLANRIFRLVQVSGVLFNLAVVLTMAVMLSVTDRAFGWQSSLVDSAESVDQIVEVVSLPWQWIVSDSVARPSFEEIVGSRIVLRESKAALESEDLLSWWPFLMMCVLVYGLFPRSLAWLFSCWNERRLLRQLRFDGFGSRVILERMRSVDLQTHGQASGTVSGQSESGSSNSAEQEFTVTESKQIRFYTLEATIERYGAESLRGWLSELLGLDISELVGLSALNGVEAMISGEGQSKAHYLLIEGWQPPIQETLNQLADLARGLEKMQEQAVLLLVGKPSKEEGVRALPESMQQVWKTKIRLLKCANLKVFTPQISSS